MYRITFRLEWVENAGCATDFELKYWESGRFEQRSTRVRNSEDINDISLELTVEPCLEYNYVITASRDSPYAEDSKQGTFKTDCAVSNTTTNKGAYTYDARNGWGEGPSKEDKVKEVV